MISALKTTGTAALVLLQVLFEEQLAENAARLGPIFRQELMNIGSPLIQGVSG
jgi:acetylornithine/succinyldiaminopimelate/putrescine aminotransferase